MILYLSLPNQQFIHSLLTKSGYLKGFVIRFAMIFGYDIIGNIYRYIFIYD